MSLCCLWAGVGEGWGWVLYYVLLLCDEKLSLCAVEVLYYVIVLLMGWGWRGAGVLYYVLLLCDGKLSLCCVQGRCCVMSLCCVSVTCLYCLLLCVHPISVLRYRLQVDSNARSLFLTTRMFCFMTCV